MLYRSVMSLVVQNHLLGPKSFSFINNLLTFIPADLMDLKALLLMTYQHF